MIKVLLRNGWVYVGEVLNETSEILILKDVKGHEVTIQKKDISVWEVEE